LAICISSVNIGNELRPIILVTQQSASGRFAVILLNADEVLSVDEAEKIPEC
jgi:hypothetical protein